MVELSGEAGDAGRFCDDKLEGTTYTAIPADRRVFHALDEAAHVRRMLTESNNECGVNCVFLGLEGQGLLLHLHDTRKKRV